jgi:hypothetical protein
MLRAYEKVLLQVLINARISFPVEGLLFNCDMHKISNNAKFGPVSPTHLSCMHVYRHTHTQKKHTYSIVYSSFCQGVSV